MYPPLKNAHSFSTGIIFYSEQNKEYATMATIDEFQNIKTEQLSKKEAAMEAERIDRHFETAASNTVINIAMFLIAILAIITISYFFDTNHSIELLRIFDGVIIPFFLFSSAVVVILAGMFALFFSVETRKFHASEHMIVNAYKKLHRVPSIEELRKFSRFYNYCGTNMMLAILFFCVVYLIRCFFNLDYLLYAIITLVLELSLPLGLFNFVQAIVTITPTDRELNVAIEGLKAWLENEQKSKK